MIANNGNLDHFARLARAAQMRGDQTICFQIDALRGYSRFVDLWEGTIGEVVGRVFEDSDDQSVPGIAHPRNVKYFTVRIRVADVLEAWRRRQEREARQFGSISL